MQNNTSIFQHNLLASGNEVHFSRKEKNVNSRNIEILQYNYTNTSFDMQATTAMS